MNRINGQKRISFSPGIEDPERLASLFRGLFIFRDRIRVYMDANDPENLRASADATLRELLEIDILSIMRGFEEYGHGTYLFRAYVEEIGEGLRRLREIAYS